MSHQPRVLVADDEEDVHFICRINFELEGFEILEAHDGEEALRMINEERPDAVLLDVMMPVMDGWECLDAIRSNACLKDIPVVMLTAKVQQSDQIRGLTAGADDYVTKPFHPTTVVNTVRQIVGTDLSSREERRRRALRQLEMLARI